VKRERKIPRKGEPAARRIVRRPEVRRRTGYSDTTIWRKEKAGEFPKRIALSPDGMAVGWFEDEIDEWIQSRIRGPGKRPALAKRVHADEDDSKPINDQPAGTGIVHNGGPPLDGRRSGAAVRVEPTRSKRANARQLPPRAKPASPARGIAVAAVKRGRGARSGARAR
jgi:prophage regulatory protein